MAVALEGYLLRLMSPYLRAAFLVGGLLLVHQGLVTGLMGVAILALATLTEVASYRMAARKAA